MFFCFFLIAIVLELFALSPSFSLAAFSETRYLAEKSYLALPIFSRLTVRTAPPGETVNHQSLSGRYSCVLSPLFTSPATTLSPAGKIHVPPVISQFVFFLQFCILPPLVPKIETYRSFFHHLDCLGSRSVFYSFGDDLSRLRWILCVDLVFLLLFVELTLGGKSLSEYPRSKVNA